MNISKLYRSFICSNKLYRYILLKVDSEVNCEHRLFHTLCRKPAIAEHQLLQPSALPAVIQQNGMKVKGKVERRCPSCQLMWRKGRLYNLCKEYPRHNQMSTMPKPKSTWILTWASQSPRRPW